MSAVTTAQRPEWRQEHAADFRAFLATATGRQFAELLRWDEQDHNRKAVAFLDNHSYRSGFGQGFGERTRSILKLSADVRPQQDDNSGAGDGATPDAERLAP